MTATPAAWPVVPDTRAMPTAHPPTVRPAPTHAAGTGRHHIEALGHAAVPVSVFVPTPPNLPSGRRRTGISGQLARVRTARTQRGA